ncbi:hypothetical protein EJB05_17226, partial [Eragrostis curvula]
MGLKDQAEGGCRGDNNESSLCYQIAIELLLPGIFLACLFYATAIVVLIVRTLDGNVNMDGCCYTVSSSVELVGVKGLEPALDPGAASPAFDLLVRVDNGHVYDSYREGGNVTVSYAGVPLAHGRTPAFRVGAMAAVTFTVNATTEAVGVLEDLFRLMSAERRWDAAQLEVSMKLGWPGWESYAWSVDLDGIENRAEPELSVPAAVGTEVVVIILIGRHRVPSSIIMKPESTLSIRKDGADEKSRKVASWSEIRTILYMLLALALSPLVYFLVFDLPPKFSVQITDIQGLDDAASLSTVFKINLHASNKRGSGSTCYRHGEAVVRYSGFTLALGRTRTFCVGAKDTMVVPVVAWADDVRLPKEMGERMVAEQRAAGSVELEVDVKLFAKEDSMGAEPTWLWCKVVTGRAEPSDVTPCSVFRLKFWASDFAPHWMLA